MTVFIIALVFALVAPGSGQFYNGEYLKGACFGVVYAAGLSVIAPLFARALRLDSKEAILKFMSMANMFYACVTLLSVLDAALVAWRGKNGDSGGILMAGIFAIMIVSVYKGLKRPGLIDALAGISGFSAFVTGKKWKFWHGDAGES